MGNIVRPVPTGPLLTDRALETFIGVVIGVAIGWIVRPRASRPAIAVR